MRQLALTLMLCVTAQALFSQQDSLLKKFKYRVDHYRAIGFNINSSGAYYKSDFTSGSNKSSGFSGAAGASYYSISSTDRILFTAFSSLGSSFNSNKNNNTNNENKDRSFSLMPGVNIQNKWFSKNRFTELGTDIAAYVYSGKNTISNTAAAATNKQQQYSIAINAGIGKGRLENVTDMQNALWLYKELQAEKSITGTLSATELFDLGRSITRGNNTRVLDARKRTKFILETVDDYLQQKGLVNKTDIRYFSSLNDILFFAFNNQRLSGTEKFIRITPGINSWNNDQKQSDGINKYERKFTSKSVVFTTGLNKYIPASLVHQNNYGAVLKLSYQVSNFKEKFLVNDMVQQEYSSKPEIKQAAVNAFFQHSIYPNTRTIFDIELRSEAGYQDVTGQTSFYGNASLSGNLNYFISYRTRFTCSLGASYQKNSYNTFQSIYLLPETLQLNANAGIEINL